MTYEIILAIAVSLMAFGYILAINSDYQEYQVLQTSLDNTLLGLVLTPVKKPLGKPIGGQYLYLRLGILGERHPFSVLDYDDKTGNIQLSIRVVGDFTTLLSRLVIGERVKLDGYYGHYTQNLDITTPTLLIAGGVGIAPFWSMINQHSSNLSLIYCTSSLTDSVNLQPLKQLLGTRLSHHIGNQNRLQPKDIEEVLNSITAGNNTTIQVYICAGRSLTGMVTQELERLGVVKTNIHIEEFGY